MGQYPHALIRRLQAAQQIVEVSDVEESSRVQNMGCFKYLTFFDLYLAAVEETADEQQNFKRGIGQLEDNIRKHVFVADINQLTQEILKQSQIYLKLAVVGLSFVSLILQQLFGRFGNLRIVHLPQPFKHLLCGSQVALSELGKRGLEAVPVKLQGEFEFEWLHGLRPFGVHSHEFQRFQGHG